MAKPSTPAPTFDVWRQRAAELSIRSNAFIDGAFVESLDGKRFDCVSPIDGKVIASVAECGVADVDRAVLIETDTAEEATCQPRAWVKQRSRWLKGYMVTWAVHMRQPRRLWRELGPRRFWGVQVLFLGTISQFLLAPVLWSCWLLVAGLPHPLAGLPAPLLWALTGLFLASEAVNIATGLIGLAATRHRGLMLWVPTLSLYFPLGALAAAKGVWELIGRPFYWDKTTHGHHTPADDTNDDTSPTESAPPPLVPALSAS